MSNSSVGICAMLAVSNIYSKVCCFLLHCVDKDVSRLTIFMPCRARHRVIPHGNEWMEIVENPTVSSDGAWGIGGKFSD